jgi:FkbM family methyltransferase
MALEAITLPFRVWSEVSDAQSLRSAHYARALPRRLWDTSTLVEANRLNLDWQLDLRDNVQRTLFFSGTYEKAYLRLLSSAIRSGGVFVDVGAHIGIHSLTMARVLGGGGSVISFEAAADTAEGLRTCVRRNSITNISVQQVALGDHTGTVELHSDDERFEIADAAVRSVHGPGKVVETVKVRTLDDWVEANGLEKLDVMKIDVEGEELAVLRGAKSTIGRFQPRLIGIEIRDYLLRQAGVSEPELRELLAELGYEEHEHPHLEGNFAFVRKS